MDIEQKLDVILLELQSLKKGQSNLESRFEGLENKFELLREDLNDFKFNTEEEFTATRKLIDQAFEKISDNFKYQDKVTQIKNILYRKQKSFA